MSAHNANNSQCDLNMYGPDPGDGSVKCTCDEDAPIEPAVGPARPVLIKPATAEMQRFSGTYREAAIGPTTGPDSVTLTGRAAATHLEMRAAGQELRAAQDLYRKAEARWKAALDAHMQELA